MVKKRVFDKGDIVRVCLNPTVGNEVQGDFRPCIVLSPKRFNSLGVSLVAPITQGENFARVKGFTVSLMGTGIETQGVILLSGVRMMDLVARKATKIEEASSVVVDEALAILSAILD